MKVEEVLQESGLSEKEALVYLALLKTGEEMASRVSEVSEMNRVTTYSLLKSLQEKGFCSVCERNKIHHFKPTSPKNIIKLLDGKREKFESIISELGKYEQIVSDKPEISLFEGKKGISIMLDRILNDSEKSKEVLGYGNVTMTERMIEYESLQWRKDRINKKIKIKAVVDKFNRTHFDSHKGWHKLAEVRVFKNLSNSDSYTLIGNNIIGIIVSKGELHGILISSEQVVKKEKMIFDLLWKQAKA